MKGTAAGRLIAALCLAAAGLAEAAPPAPVPGPDPGQGQAQVQRMDLGALSKATRTEELDEDGLRAALFGRTGGELSASSAAVLKAGTYAVAASVCGAGGCQATVAVLAGEGERLSVKRRAALSPGFPVFPVEGYDFLAVALSDVDGDGQAELLLRYGASEPPRRALGALRHEVLTVYRVPSLSPLFQEELRRSGGDSEPRCEAEVQRGSVAAGAPELRVERRCRPPGCEAPGCAGAAERRIYRLDRPGGRFRAQPPTSERR